MRNRIPWIRRTEIRFARPPFRQIGNSGVKSNDIPLVYEYLIYVAAIIVGIVLLIFLRRASKLPTHQKLQERMAAHLQDMDGYVTSLREGKETGVRFFKMISKLLYTTDKLIYAASALARKRAGYRHR